MKKQLDALVKKVEFFEKLAVYGDRGSFLQALARDDLDPKTKALLEEMANLLAQAGVTDESVLNPLYNALEFGHVNLEAIRSAVTQAAVRDPSIANAGINQKLRQLAQQLTSHPVPELINNTSPIATNEVPQAPAPTGYPMMDKEEQKALSRIVTMEGIGIPFSPTGRFDKNTQIALQAFKKKFNISSMSDVKALTFAKMLAETAKYSTDPDIPATI